MTTDLAVRPDPQGTTTAAIATLADWANELNAAGALAQQLCQTPFVPAHFRGKPADAAAAILTGHELGLSPMASLRSIFVINGTPGMYAITLRAVIQNRGHRVWVAEASAERVVVQGVRAGTDQVVESVWTIDRARKAGLFSNKKYETEPQNMLTARATVEVCRLIAADALLGIPYSAEELEDLPPIQAGPATVGQRVTAAEVLGTAAPAPGPVEQPEPAPPTERGITQPQIRKLHALMTEKGMTNREATLDWMNGTLDRVDRPLTTTKELTAREAGVLIDAMEALPNTAAAQPAGGAE